MLPKKFFTGLLRHCNSKSQMNATKDKIICSEECEAEILLIDDNVFNLLPLIGMLKQNLNMKTVSC